MKDTSSLFLSLVLGLVLMLPGKDLSGAELTLPSIFGDHMVLQRDLDNPVWGKANPGEHISVTIADQRHETQADAAGNWKLKLDPLAAGGPFEMVVEGESDTKRFEDVLVGEVWFCSGQSNMFNPVVHAYDADLDIATANYPEIRLLTVPRRGTLEPTDDFEGRWFVCSPRTVPPFSAVGYYFGRRIHNALGVPVGLVSNSWGGSSAEAWLPREFLEADPESAEVVEEWDKLAAEYTDERVQKEAEEYERRLAIWQENGEQGVRPNPSFDPRNCQRRPGTIFNGMVYPTIGYGMRGMIWYQGESNAMADRPEEYRRLFPALIEYYRDIWGQGDFPFYWVQLAGFGPKLEEPEGEPPARSWAVLRESQTETLSLPNTGEAVIFETGEVKEIHPRDKQTVADRLARHALAKDYGIPMATESPRFKSLEVKDGKVLVSFDNVGKRGLYTFDVDEVEGFSIAGADGKFYWAEAKITGKDKVTVSHPEVPHPTEVRYAWGNNPDGNLRDWVGGLPVTPFRAKVDEVR
ncbi:sialate O-acetylesterase [Ruficoccus amylovorans]|uniref:Sialate O-acetylesterase n=1 Tax=Ruficoccus amylovorans TaxID=1804625 RepID=A0A842HFS6_9BACT|nr:sialate O-acetylesterase [Ruficoccus amylovorans]MBC2595060.1 sialate O-acetylesterase [Ruficoccus amylovorans]